MADNKYIKDMIGAEEGKPIKKEVPKTPDMDFSDKFSGLVDEMLTCEICGKIFTEDLYLIHMRQHKGEKPFVCKECGKAYSENFQFQIHLRTHTGEKPFKCTQCPKEFSSNNGLRIHLNVHSQDRPFICGICGNTFKIEITLKEHLRVHTGEKPFKCTGCTATFARQANLSRHTKSHHPHLFLLKKKKRHEDKKHIEQQRPLSSNDNNLDNPVVVALQTEDIYSGEDKNGKFKCSMCPMRFLLSKYLKAHAKKAHPDLIDYFGCDECDASFPTCISLSKHVKIHKAVLLSNFLVNGRTNSTSKINKSDIKPPLPITDIYKKKKNVNGALNAHRRVHFTSKPFKCRVCEDRFSTSHYAREHRSNVHNDDKMTKKSFGLQCEICGLSFSSRCYLWVHERKHEDRHRFQCRICKTTFSNYALRRVHFWRHARQKLYVLRQQGIVFSDSASKSKWCESERKDNKHDGILNAVKDNINDSVVYPTKLLFRMQCGSNVIESEEKTKQCLTMEDDQQPCSSNSSIRHRKGEGNASNAFDQQIEQEQINSQQIGSQQLESQQNSQTLNLDSKSSKCKDRSVNDDETEPVLLSNTIASHSQSKVASKSESKNKNKKIKLDMNLENENIDHYEEKSNSIGSSKVSNSHRQCSKADFISESVRPGKQNKHKKLDGSDSDFQSHNDKAVGIGPCNTSHHDQQQNRDNDDFQNKRTQNKEECLMKFENKIGHSQSGGNKTESVCSSADNNFLKNKSDNPYDKKDESINPSSFNISSNSNTNSLHQQSSFSKSKTNNESEKRDDLNLKSENKILENKKSLNLNNPSSESICPSSSGTNSNSSTTKSNFSRQQSSFSMETTNNGKNESKSESRQVNNSTTNELEKVKEAKKDLNLTNNTNSTAVSNTNTTDAIAVTESEGNRIYYPTTMMNVSHRHKANYVSKSRRSQQCLVLDDGDDKDGGDSNTIYPCDVCWKVFNSRANLMKHQSIFHV